MPPTHEQHADDAPRDALHLQLEQLARRVGRLLGDEVVGWRTVAGGYSEAIRRVARLRSGTSVFVKAATDARTAVWLDREAHVYDHLPDAPFLAKFLGYDAPFANGEHPILVLEDLSAGRWPPPWSPPLVDRVLQLIELLESTDLPGARRQEAVIDESGGGRTPWNIVAADPAPFLALGLCSRSWLDRALPAFLDAQERADFHGDALVHNDLRGDNLCVLGDRLLLVDWNWAARGTRLYDRSRWAPSLHAQGGPAPEIISPDAGALAVWHAGNWAHQAPRMLRDTGALASLKLVQLRITLGWAARCLDLPEPGAAVP